MLLLCVAQAALSESTKDKRLQETRNVQRDEEELVEMGKFIPLEQQVRLSEKLAAYFALPTPEGITASDALRYQAHLLLHLLNDAVVPVVRSEVLCALRANVAHGSFTKDQVSGVYCIDVSPHQHHCSITLTHAVPC